MNARTKLNNPLTIRFHLTDGTTHDFAQPDAAISEKFYDDITLSRLFSRPRIVVGSEHSKSVFVVSEIIRVDFHHDSFQCWKFPGGFLDLLEISEEEFRRDAWLDKPTLMIKRERPTRFGGLLVSVIKLQMRGGHPLFIKVKALAKLPAESQSFMQFLLSKATVYIRLRGGGISVVNLSNLGAYTVYPGVAQLPADSWLAEPMSLGANSISYENQSHSNTE